MALGMVTGVLGAVQGIGGLLGGGGPRQPRMNRAQRQHMQQHQQQHRQMQQMKQMMMQMMQMMHRGMGGRQCGRPQGQCCQHGMNGANQFGNMGNFSQNPMGNMFNQQPTININLGGGGGHFGRPPMGGAHYAMGMSMYA